MARKARSPFDVPLSEEQRKTLGLWIGQELNNAIAARSAQEVEVDYWHALYEQARTRSQNNLPWPDAADLTSYIACEKVDSIHARLMKTIFVDPICVAEGWGDAGERAAYVEEFLQWKAAEERLPSVLDKLSLISMIEPRGLVEVYESSETRQTRKTINAKAQLSEAGGFAFGEDGTPQLEVGADGKYTEAGPDDTGVTMVVDSPESVRTGPQYRVIPYRDSLILPAHARDKADIWGTAKRFWKRKPEIVAQAEGANAIYDKAAVDMLTDTGDREPDQSLMRNNLDIAPQYKETAEKELWEAQILVDLNGILEQRGEKTIKGSEFNGARWYVVTLHLDTNNLLRLNHDDLDRSRYVPVILFPRTDRATEGFSFIGHKLVTVIEEHTAYRNMAADRSSLAVNAPITKMQGALWDEDEQPWGPKAVVEVRDPHEITQVQVADVPASVFSQIAYCDRTAERIAGVNDVAAGQTTAGADKTLGEVQMATEQSFVRMDLIVKRFDEALEEIYQIRHAIWKRVLAENPMGIDAPDSLTAGIEARGQETAQLMPDGKITANLIDGSFRFKPYGSVETADPGRMRADFIQGIQGLGPLLQAFPLLRSMFGTPQAARAMGRQYLRVFRIQNQKAFLGSPSQDLMQQQQLNGLPPAQTIPPPPPGMMPQGMMPPGMGAPGLPGINPPSASPGLPGIGPLPPMAPGPIGVQ